MSRRGGAAAESAGACWAGRRWTCGRGGFRGAFLWVIERNDGARHFYLRLGGREGERVAKPIGGHPTPLVPIAWDDLGALEAACAAGTATSAA